MAPEPPPPQGPYDQATSVNTDPKFLNDASTGQPILGDGVQANLDDLTGYSDNIDQIQTNFAGLGRTVTGVLRELIQSAFPAGEGNGLEWTGYFNRLASHNAGQIEIFNFNIANGIRNVAMAAQTVANAYGNTDETSAANMQAISFAFGETQTAPPGIPQWLADRLPTWAEFQRANPGAGVVVPENGIPPENITVVENGNTRTMTVQLPDGSTMVTVVNTWSTYSGGPSGSTQTVYLNGQKMEVTETSSYGSTTTTTTTQSIYDQNSRHVRDQVSSRDRETVSAQGTNLQTDRQTTTYTYDGNGQQTDESTVGTSTSVGLERPHEGTIDIEDDPAQRQIDELMPEPEEIILAPGPFEGDPGYGQPQGELA